MAIAKDIAIHGNKNIHQCATYIENHDKTNINSSLNKYADEEVQKVLDYAENSEKTSLLTDGDEDLLVSGIECQPETASIQFQMDNHLYHDKHGYKNLGTKVNAKTGEVNNKEEIDAYHIIQSFEYDKTLDPRLVHKLGLEFAERSFPGHRAVVCTHMNTDHLHNHILLNAYAKDGLSKIPMNNTFRQKYRKINDELSLEYGLPILLEPSHERTSDSYLEWMSRKEGNSWKECLRNDIKEAAQLSSTWDEFVELIESNGYQVKERDKYVLYTVEDAIKKGSRYEERRVRDKTLGKEYTKEAILKEIEKNNSNALTNDKSKEIPVNKEKQKYINLHINRYSADGRRRSDLEIMILKAIKLIKFFMNKNWDPDKSKYFKSSPSWYSAETKLKAMEQSLVAIQELGISNISELTDMLKQTGADLQSAKRNQADLEAVIDYAERITNLINKMSELQKHPIIKEFNKDKFNIPMYSSNDVSKNKAKAVPMTPKQKRELYTLLMDNDEYKLTELYENMSYMDAKTCIEYLNDNTKEKPSILMDYDEGILINKYNKIYNTEIAESKEKLSKQPITPSYIPELKRLIAKHNIVPEKDCDDFISRLDQYQALQIIKCCGERPDVKPASNDQNRIEQGIIKQIEELLVLKGEPQLDFPISELSMADGYRLRNYLLYKGKSPDIQDALVYLTNKRFTKELENYSVQDTPVLCEYRDILKELARLGIDESNLNAVLEQQNAIISDYSNAGDRLDELNNLYKTLRNLSYNISLTESTSFTHGPLFRGEAIKVDIDEKGKDQDQELEKDETAISNNKEKSKLRVLPDHWYDRW